MDTILDILHHKYLGNSLLDYCIALGVFIFSFAVLGPVKIFLLKKVSKGSEKTRTKWDDFFVTIIDKNGNWFIWLLSLMIASRFVTFRDQVFRLANSFFVIFLTFLILRILQSLLTFWFEKSYLIRIQHDKAKVSAMSNMMMLFKAGIWLVGLFFILDNLGFNITTAVAGLGIGGIAVALAGQAILGDAFSSFSIFLDKPFEVGDLVVIGEYSGVVEHIGIKTTRIRSLSGEQLVFSNSDLTASRIRNYKRMQERRIIFSLGVVYQTPLEKLKKVKELIQKVLEATDRIRVDRVHFKSYGDFSLNFEIVFYVLSPDYLEYMDIQEKVNFGIFEAFQKEGIEFAYPTQTLFIEKTQ
ncbi:MAG: hypothetical protein A3I75_04280 [Deltaproteobacteria bacterium RIFCSPLOWO2_02_FULL_50_16]|nr:MAG: hypothetical protein A2053_01485 [Deltaproteobacteria bacterium GWA2_50_8]OGQ57820.1 MAG: hypothetical protein A3I75_04280 [Deltaproteobacteria bacterium RIFCSPLOWO2_02_FULL_50_16]